MAAHAQRASWRIAGAAVVALLFGGCAQMRTYQPAIDPAGLSDIQFVHYLESVPRATFGEACRAVLIVVDGETRFGDHASRYAELRRRGAVRDAWGLEADHVLDTGTLAFMAARICALPPTVDTVLFGAWGLGDRRYAVQQAVRWEILEYAPAHHPLTGGELLHAVAHMDDYLARRGRGGEAPEIDAPADIPTAASTCVNDGTSAGCHAHACVGMRCCTGVHCCMGMRETSRLQTRHGHASVAMAPNGDCLDDGKSTAGAQG